ncbi:hypothetical protein Btru_015409 [Bulinus truncatus]|nr:hypothetical protein Btru_015409 [Bulinus truncatus]
MSLGVRLNVRYILTALVSAVITYCITIASIHNQLTLQDNQNRGPVLHQRETGLATAGYQKEIQPLQCQETGINPDQKKIDPTDQAVPPARPMPKVQLEETSAQEFTRRKKRLDHVCDVTRVRGKVHGVYTDKSGVIYCYVPKAGCTFWKRIFAATHYSYAQSPLRMSRNAVHRFYGDGVNYTIAHNESAYPIRLLVARDPFSRLLSSYLDKIYLPDFWPSQGRNMLRARTMCDTDFMRNHFDKMASLFEGGGSGYSTCKETYCKKYLTFKEFVKGGFSIHEPHWMPIHAICNPCVFNVTHLSFMESFNQDARPILAKMGMAKLLDYFDETKQVENEIEMLVDYHFNRTHDPNVDRFYRPCITPRELAYRLWHSFQWKGYIDPDMTYIIPNYTVTEYVVKKDLLHQVWAARRSGLDKPEVMREARESFRERAFRTLPRSLFENLMMKYKLDFELFGYEHIRNSMYSILYNGDYEIKFGFH